LRRIANRYGHGILIIILVRTAIDTAMSAPRATTFNPSENQTLNSPDILRFPQRVGLGTYRMGESADRHEEEVAAVRFALDVGYRMLDTAELYGDGGCERMLASALTSFGRARRSELFIISKVLPANAARADTIRSCEASIQRLGCEYLDLYLLHSKGTLPFVETVRAFDELLKRGLVRQIGVSNFAVDDLVAWRKAEERVGIRSRAKVNQLLYRMDRRGVEYGLLDYQRAHGMQMMASEPLGHGSLPKHPLLIELGRERGVSAAQIALAWLLREPDMIVIPKSVHPQRIEENLRAADLRLSAEELRRIDQAFPLRHRWLKKNRLLRTARSTARRVVGGLKGTNQ
jgi:diketogulonate reductase-like aldo/keto reductase